MTTLTTQLNDMMKPGSSGIYSGGKGVLIRQPDYLTVAMHSSNQSALNTTVGSAAWNAGFWTVADQTTVVPGSLLVNDIIVPSTVYAGMGAGGGNPMCPNGGGGCPADPKGGDTGPWNYAQLGYVVGHAMSKLFNDFDNIQSASWGWGVFYASDANSCDHRCHYMPDFNGYDCPGYWIPFGGSPSADPNKHGPGFYPAGNPDANPGSGGGGTGCHFDWSNPTQVLPGEGAWVRGVRRSTCPTTCPQPRRCHSMCGRRVSIRQTPSTRSRATW